ncbi:MAG: PLP-dependent aminotransferase family protein [Candidatus Izemoplasmatales bacterium]
MITIFFDEASSTPLYEQLYRKLKEMILSSTLKASDKLPSKRKLASHLKCSEVTVESAYLQLMAEGFIRSVPRSGYFVEEIDPFFHSNQKELKVVKQNIRFTYEFDLKTNLVDDTHFPYQVWNKIMKNVYQPEYASELNDIPFEGYYPLRKEIAKYVLSYRGISVLPEQIIVGSGSDYLLQLITLILGKEEHYMIENPSFVKTKRLYESFGCSVKFGNLDENGLSTHDLISHGASVVHVSPSHQFPTGIVMPYSRRIELLKWANEDAKHYIIEDDYDSEFRFIGNPIPALKGLDQYDKVIYMNSFSKSLSPTKRISFMILPLELLKILEEQYKFFSNPVTMSEQIGLYLFMKDGHFERHLNRMKQLYKSKRDDFIEILERSPILHDRIQIEGESAGLHFIVRFDKELSEELMTLEAKKKSLRLYPLSEYCFENEKRFQNKFVFGYAHLTKENMMKIVSILERVVEDVLLLKKTNNER